ncbi:MAG: hypothetical protein GC155_07595 [Alphaproteobacteria bacterium]|nr:hypothetical protein [Alphaproteobacteria bacterium]
MRLSQAILIIGGLTAGCLAALAPAAAQADDAAFYDAAYARCTKELTAAIKPPKGQVLTFAAKEATLGVYGDEYGFSFNAGSISMGPKGAPVASEHVGSCWGVPGRRSLHLVVLNGKPVSETLISF